VNQEYFEKGFIVIRDFFTASELLELTSVVSEFHQSWKAKNKIFYMEKAVNSAYLTGTEHLTVGKRAVIFKLSGSKKLMDKVHSVIPERLCFMNTQLFFDPVNAEQDNYWHRDPQYHMTVEQQQQALSGPDVIHFRIPLKNELGIELVPGTHKRWDTDDELAVRLETDNRKNHEDLSTGLAIELTAGDLLIFSANMIHRGLYGKDRLALDILFCEPAPGLAQFVADDCLPNQATLHNIEDASAFINIMKLKAML
jgi:ectoine hydroxylase-related dioxygenase (phytanoyl-CoA dioxygenase family)